MLCIMNIHYPKLDLLLLSTLFLLDIFISPLFFNKSSSPWPSQLKGIFFLSLVIQIKCLCLFVCGRDLRPGYPWPSWTNWSDSVKNGLFEHHLIAVSLLGRESWRQKIKTNLMKSDKSIVLVLTSSPGVESNQSNGTLNYNDYRL